MDIISLARDFAKKIQEDERYLRLDMAKTANDNDEELQNLIGEFNLKRMALNTEASKENADSEKVEELNKELMAVYSSIMENKNMAEYQNAKEQVDKFMNHINAILVAAVNGEDPDTVEEPHSCSGHCSSCGGC